eukprot:1161329-Pelagomonas_calceolata.AAC.5
MLLLKSSLRSMPVSKPSKLNSPQMLQPISASSLPDAPGPQREKERVSVVYRGLELEVRVRMEMLQ